MIEIGIIGMALIIIAWVPETIRTLRTKKTGLELRFNIIYVLGSLLLTVYAITIQDIIFTTLNAILFLISLLNLRYTLRERE